MADASIKTERTGKVQTVLGLIDPADLGITLTHEHILVDLRCHWFSPDEASERDWIDKPVTLDRLGGVTSRFYNLDSMVILEEKAAVEETFKFKLAGGGSLVDVTSIGIGRDPLALARISRATGLNLIMGGGHYVPWAHPPGMDEETEESITEALIKDINVGVYDTGIRSGLLGELGHGWPMTDNERKALRAAAFTQRKTGAPILIHHGFHRDSPMDIIGVLDDAGAALDQVIMGHLDIFNDTGLLTELLGTGCYLEWDVFGGEDTSFGKVADGKIDFLNDEQRLDMIEFVVNQGFADRITVAHDTCWKYQTSRYGGKGYAHLIESIIPRMRRRGFDEATISAIFMDNPARALTFR